MSGVRLTRNGLLTPGSRLRLLHESRSLAPRLPKSAPAKSRPAETGKTSRCYFY